MYQIELQKASVINIPFQVLDNDFTFVVNGKEYKTNHLIADMISPIISKTHIIDPTIDKYIINTFNAGNFNNILSLISFRSIDIQHLEIPFIEEVLDILGSNYINIDDTDINNPISFENVFDRITKHEIKENLFSKSLRKEIDFISSNFWDAIDIYKEKTKKLSITILERILLNPILRLNTEDQLLKFINELYNEKENYFILYEYVDFFNVSSMQIMKFINIFNFEIINQGVRKSFLKGIMKKLMNTKPANNNWRYKQQNNSRNLDSPSLKGKILYNTSNIDLTFDDPFDSGNSF